MLNTLFPTVISNVSDLLIAVCVLILTVPIISTSWCGKGNAHCNDIRKQAPDELDDTK